MNCGHKEKDKATGLCTSCGFNTRGLTNKELKSAKSAALKKKMAGKMKKARKEVVRLGPGEMAAGFGGDYKKVRFEP